MKVVMKVLLAIAIVLLSYVSWKSIQGQIDFNSEVAKRDKAVIQRLVDIRTAQVALRGQMGTYTGSFDTLTQFIKDGKIATLVKEGDLTEAQLEAGMTEDKAMRIINSGNQAAIKAAGLWNDAKNAPQLVRDSIFSPAVEVLFPNRKQFSIDSLRYVPYGGGTEFEMGIDTLESSAGYTIQVFEAKAHYNTYLGDLDGRLLRQKIQEVLDRPGNKYPGMQVGSLEVPNNNAVTGNNFSQRTNHCMFLPENIDLAHSEEYNLSIAGADGFSFCIRNATDPSLFHHQGTPIGSKLSHTEHIKRLILDSGFFTQPFKKTSVTIVSPEYTLVPDSFYEREKKEELYAFNIYHTENQKIVADSFQEEASTVLFGMDEELYAFLSRNLWTPVIRHHAALLLHTFHSRRDREGKNSCFVDFHDQLVTIICFSDKGLLSANSFPAKNPHNTTYYIASVWEKLNLNQSTDKLFLSGNLTPHKATTDILKKLIRNVERMEIKPTVEAEDELLNQLPTDMLALL